MFTSNIPQTPLELMREAVMAGRDTERPLSVRQRQQILHDLAELQAGQPDLTNVFLARSVLRCSRSTWSLIQAGKYRGDIDRYLRRAVQWMADRLARAEAPQADYVPTKIGRYIMKVCQRAWSVPTIGVVVTPSGAGKTAALMEYARRRGDRAQYIPAGKAISTMQGLISELAGRLHVPVTTRSTSATLYRSVRDALADYYAAGKGDPFVIIVDEATTLRARAKNMLRNLHDDPAVRCAVVLADTARLNVDLNNRSGRALYEQLRSRSGAQFLMTVDEEIAAEDVRAVADSILKSLDCKRALHRDSYKFLHSLAQAEGKLRNVAYRLHAVHDVAGEVGQAPTYSVAELDFVADLVGGKRQLRHEAAPFGRPAKRPPADAAAKVA